MRRYSLRGEVVVRELVGGLSVHRNALMRPAMTTNPIRAPVIAAVITATILAASA